jgi:hypothetical protein
VKFVKPTKTILHASDKFGGSRDDASVEDLSLLEKRVIKALKDKDLKVSKVRPFFWSLVETYVDRFNQYPFDMSKALISYLELNDYPEETVQHMVSELEKKFEQIHGRPLRKATEIVSHLDALDDEIRQLRDSLKYAAMVAESDNEK